MKPTALIEETVKEYICAHPDYELPSRSYHPMALIHALPIRKYAVDKFIGIDMYWRILLDAAKICFKPNEDSFEYRCFVSMLNSAGGMSTGTDYEQQIGDIWRDFLVWKNGE